MKCEYIAFLILGSLMFTDPASAQTRNACSVLSQLERLELDLADVRAGKQEPAVILTRVVQIQSAFQSQKFSESLTATDLDRLKLYTKTIKQKVLDERELTAVQRNGLATSQLPSINKLLMWLSGQYECRKDKVVAIGLDRPTPATTKSDARLGNRVEERSQVSELNLGRSIDLVFFIVALIIFLAFIGLPANCYLCARRERLTRQSDCHTSALLTFGNNCTVTHVISVGKRGAKIQAPIMDIPTKSVVLYLAGYKIPAKLDWANNYYLGVHFVDAISDEVVDRILEASHDSDPLARVGENATDCFYPDCHVNCEKHSFPQI